MHYRSTREPAVENKAGNIYYVRLKTPVGPMYKLGFTSMRSVQERLAFQGGGDERLVDRVLCFVASPNALATEQKLHRHFRRAAVFPLPELQMPLVGNGQSEVYVEDILGIDPEYTPAQGQRMREAVMSMRMIRTGSSAADVGRAVEEKRQVQQDVENVVAMARMWPISWLVLAWQKMDDLLFRNYHDKSQAAEIRELLQWLRRSSGVQNRGLAARGQQTDPHQRADDLRKRAAAQRTWEGKVHVALEALECRDLVAFEMVVDVDKLVKSLLREMMADLRMGSDFAIVAANCDLVELCDAILDRGTDLLVVPVYEGWKALVREWVARGKLPSEHLKMPPDPIFFRTDDRGVQTVHDVSPISTYYYGPSNFLRIFGRQWHWPAKPTMVENSAWFDVEVVNEVTGFRCVLQVYAWQYDEERLTVEFPNFNELYMKALDAVIEHKEAVKGKRVANTP